ncbi:MAG: EI24 domain-containing protein [Lachnospiraceae bacterium]|nr:EI24 domain-containing protein [Lachnospiraceae bacterium]
MSSKKSVITKEQGENAENIMATVEAEANETKEAVAEEKKNESENETEKIIENDIEKTTESETKIENEIEKTTESEIEKKEEDSDKSDPKPVSVLQVIRFPMSKGPAFVKQHSAKVWCPAILLHALVTGFYVLCFYHSMNQKLLRAFVDFGNSISVGLRNMSEEMARFLEETLIFNIAKIPVVGDTVSKIAGQYVSDYLTLFATSVSTETNEFLYELYPAINLPESLGFLMGLLTSLLGIILSALVLKIFLCIAKHPSRSFPEIFSLLAIRCVIRIPIVFAIAIFSIFFPVIGVAVLPIALLYGVSYMYGVLLKSTDKKSENRIIFLLPFIIIFMFMITVLMFAVEGIVTGASIYSRLSVFFQAVEQVLEQSVQ